MNNTLTAQQAASFLNVPYPTFISWLSTKGFLEAFKDDGKKSWRVPIKALSEFVSKYTGNSQSFGSLYANGLQLDVYQTAPQGYVTLNEAAKILGKDNQYVSHMVNKGLLDYAKEFYQLGLRYISCENIKAFQARPKRSRKPKAPVQDELDMNGEAEEKPQASIEEQFAVLSSEILSRMAKLEDLVIQLKEGK